MESNEKLVVALYCRVAREDAIAIEGQKKLLAQHLEMEGYEHFQYYCDNGVSGLSFDRPAFQKMLSELQADRIDVVAVKDPSRIGRDFRSVTAWIDGLMDSGKRFISVTQPYERLASLKVMDEAIKQYQRKKRSERARAVCKRKME